MLGRWRRKLRKLYPAEKPLKRRNATMLRERLPSRDEVLDTTRNHPVFAARVPQSMLEVTQMLSKLTGRRVSDVKKLIILEGIIQLLKQSERIERKSKRRLAH